MWRGKLSSVRQFTPRQFTPRQFTPRHVTSSINQCQVLSYIRAACQLCNDPVSAALAFIPLNDIIPTFEQLAEEFLEDELELLAYFEKTWIGAAVGRRRLQPMFPHSMWNVLGRHFNGSSRTTNSLESYHHSFNALISCQHPTIWVLLASLKKQHALTDNVMTRITRGDIYQHSKVEATRNRRLITLVMQYSAENANQTLRGIAYNYL